MSRPVKVRRICSMPQVREFIPRPNACEGHIQMSIDEYEVIRLIDNLGYSQKECSEQMCVARTTVQAIYDAARRKIADAIVNGRRLVIAGGNYAVCPHSRKCCGQNCCRHDENGKICCRGEKPDDVCT